MDKQPEALRLADILIADAYWSPMLGEQAAAELRRLHEVNQKLAESNVELLEALEALRKTPYMPPALIGIFDDLIAKAEGEQK